MKQILPTTFRAYIGLVVCCTVLGFGGRASAVTSADVKRHFAHPPRGYSSGPLWVWNDMLTEEQIAGTLQDLAGQNVRQVWVHPRPGLMTPYLSGDWFRLWKVALREARRLDMNVWIYDENSYPSGFAGGLVPDAMPESRGRGLVFGEAKSPPKPDENLVAVFRVAGEDYENVTDAVRAGRKLPEASYLVASVRRAGNSPWYGGKCYVDLLYPGVTERFLNVTLEAYRKEIGHEFGRRVPGSFTDEPQLRPAGGLSWTDDLPQVFEKRWGYSLIDHLPSLTRPVGDWKRVRHNYFQVLLDLFIERWAKPYYDYCERYGIEFTGHYWEHEWPNCVGVPDNMAMSAWQQRPGIDTLMNQYREDTHAQFGNARAVRELASVANQLGRERTLCEAYGAGGWDLRFEDMKRIGDWLYVLGVNTLNEHLSYITIRGARKRDHPQSFSYHEPWWDAYHVMANYFTRLSLVLSRGEQVNNVLLIQPTTTVWMYQADPKHRTELAEIGNQFQQMVILLERAQVEYDIGCEDVIARHGSIDGASLVVGRRKYATVIVPPLTENVNSETMRLLEAYLKAGGSVICCGSAPERVDGLPSERGVKVARHTGWKKADPSEVVGMIPRRAADGLAILRDENDKGILFHHRRRLEDGDILFLVNTSIESSSAGSIRSSKLGVEQWNLETGKIGPYPYSTARRGVRARFELPPCGSLLLFLADEPRPAAPSVPENATTITPKGELQIHPLEDNVLTLDYVDVTANGETRENIYFYQASQFAFAKNGMGRNPWDSAVQFHDELIAKKFAADSGLSAVYKFKVEGQVPDSLYIVIERPDLYSISCNGKSVAAERGTWWLDKSFGKIDIGDCAKVGQNSVTVKASPMTIYHELEPAYLLGDFVVKAGDSGFSISPARDSRLTLGPWNEQGHPFYATGASYRQRFEVAAPSGRYRVKLTSWYGSVAQVVMNGQSAGHIAYQPWQKDVTPLIKAGSNTIEVVVIGTLKNTLGPHHVGRSAGAAWPNMFQRGPETGPPAGEKYDTIGYGLFEPFLLEHITE